MSDDSIEAWWFLDFADVRLRALSLRTMAAIKKV